MTAQDAIGFEPGASPGIVIDPRTVFALVDEVKAELQRRYGEVKTSSFDPSQLRALGDLLDSVEAVWLKWGLAANGMNVERAELDQVRGLSTGRKRYGLSDPPQA